MTSSGTLLGGRYLLDSVIGRGGMAEVWKARDSRLGRDVAVKRLRADLSSDPTFQARFRREAQAAAGLNHHNIVAVYDTGEELDDATGVHVPYIVMELVQGHTLRDVLRDGRKILPERALEFVQGVLDALAYSHKSGIVHRDIKPANVMLTPQGLVKVMDFGIARAVADTSATMTQTAAVIGTAQYLSPEQARGETVDQRSDIYSSGCLLYELLVGRPPFTGDSPVSVAYQHVRELPVPPSQLDHEITPAMDAITLKALAKDPADRYQDARAMREDISRLLAGEPVTAPSPATPASPATAAPTQVLGAGALAGAGLAGAGLAGAGATGTQGAVGALTGAPAYGSSSTGTHQAVTDTGSFLPGSTTGTMAPVGDRPKRRRGLVLIITLLLLLAGVIAYGAFKVFGTETPPAPTQVRVPSVMGANRASAESQIINAGLKVGKVTEINGPDETKNQVTEQSPKALVMVNEGTAVNITVNLGVKTGTIPSGMLGKTEAEAKTALAAAGFTETRTETAPVNADSLAQKPGTVVNTDPAEGADHPQGSEVVIYLSPTDVPVPNVSNIGLDEAEARTRVQAAGFPDITVRTKETANDDEVGKVIEQNPVEGSTLGRDKLVTVTIGVKKDTVAVPQVIGVLRAVAQDRLQTAGFTKVRVKETVTDEAEPGTVIGVDPGEGEEVKPDQTVTLEVAKAPDAPASSPGGDGSSNDPSASSDPTASETGG